MVGLEERVWSLLGICRVRPGSSWGRRGIGVHGLRLPSRPSNAPRVNSILLKRARQPFFSVVLHLFLSHLANRSSTTSETPTRHCRSEVPGTRYQHAAHEWHPLSDERNPAARICWRRRSGCCYQVRIEAIPNAEHGQPRLGHGVSTPTPPAIVDHLQLLAPRQRPS